MQYSIHGSGSLVAVENPVVTDNEHHLRRVEERADADCLGSGEDQQEESFSDPSLRSDISRLGRSRRT